MLYTGADLVLAVLPAEGHLPQSDLSADGGRPAPGAIGGAGMRTEDRAREWWSNHQPAQV
jgi:hypothetical protein